MKKMLKDIGDNNQFRKKKNKGAVFKVDGYDEKINEVTYSSINENDATGANQTFKASGNLYVFPVPTHPEDEPAG